MTEHKAAYHSCEKSTITVWQMLQNTVKCPISYIKKSGRVILDPQSTSVIGSTPKCNHFYSMRQKKLHPFYFCNNFVKAHCIWIILAHRYRSKFPTKPQQNCPPLLMAVLTLPCDTKWSQFLHSSSNIILLYYIIYYLFILLLYIITIIIILYYFFKPSKNEGRKKIKLFRETHSKCSKCLFSALRHRKAILPLINHLITEALLVADHVSIRCYFTSATDVPHWFLINMFLRVSFSRCLQALLYWCCFHAVRGQSN